MLFAFAVGFYLLQTAPLWVEWWSTLGRFAAPPLRPGFRGLTFLNPAAALVVVALFAGPTLVLTSRLRSGRFAASVAVLLGVAVVALISGTRAGWLALAATSLAVIVTWVMTLGLRQALLVVRSVARRHGVALVIAAAATALLLAFFSPAIAQRAGASGESVRATFWLTALRMWLESPVVGTGPGTWAILRVAYTHAGEWDEYVPYAHNVELQSLAELGIFGLISAMVVAGNLVWLFRRGLRHNSETRIWSVVCVFSLFYFILQQQADFYENLPSVLFPAVFPIAMLDALTTSAESPQPVRLRMPRPVAVGLGLACAVALVVSFAREPAALRYEQAVDHLNRGEWSDAFADASFAASASPWTSPYNLAAGLAASALGDHDTAAGYFAKVAAQDGLPEAWLNLAAEESLLGKAGESRVSAANAFRVGQSRPAIAMGIVDVSIKNRDLELATTAAIAALTRLPALAADAWWSGDRSRMSVRDGAIRALDEAATPETRWEVHFVLGHYEAALDASQESGDRDLVRDLIDAWSGDSRAAQSMYSSCEASPLDTILLYWCARLAQHEGKPELQQRYRYLVAWTPRATTDGGGESRIGIPPFFGRPSGGSTAIWWGIYSYRAMGPWDLLVESVIHLDVQ